MSKIVVDYGNSASGGGNPIICMYMTVLSSPYRLIINYYCENDNEYKTKTYGSSSERGEINCGVLSFNNASTSSQTRVIITYNEDCIGLDGTTHIAGSSETIALSSYGNYSYRVLFK